MRRFTTLEVEHLEDRQMLSTVQIFAAGTTGNEQLELRIDNQFVEIFNVGDGADSRNFDTLTFESDQTIDVTSLRVSFVNDFFDPANGIDSNLVVDRIVVDGTEYQTENFRTYATALYTSENGVSSGRFATETLNVNGGFRYSEFGASPETPLRTTIAVDAGGTTGDELLQLSIDGNVVRTFDLSAFTRTFFFTANETITADRLRFSFVNDLF